MIGRFVLSVSGHDKKRIFAVIGYADEDHVLLADGMLRKVEKPKKKKLKHVKNVNVELSDITDDLIDFNNISNRRLEKLVKAAARCYWSHKEV